MSALALEIDQTLQELDAATASKFERLVRDALAMVKPRPFSGDASITFPLVEGGMPFSGDEVNGFRVVPAEGRVVTSEMVQQLMEESEAA